MVRPQLHILHVFSDREVRDATACEGGATSTVGDENRMCRSGDLLIDESTYSVRLRGHYLALATLAFGLLIDSVAVGLVDLTGGPSGLVGIPAFSVAGFDFDTPQRMYYLALALAVTLAGAIGAVGLPQASITTSLEKRANSLERCFSRP